jgi:hypothetical protein
MFLHGMVLIHLGFCPYTHGILFWFLPHIDTVAGLIDAACSNLHPGNVYLIGRDYLHFKPWSAAANKVIGYLSSGILLCPHFVFLKPAI